MTYPETMQSSALAQAERPPPIRNAVWLMYLGALLTLINIFVGMATKDTFLDRVRREAVEQGRSPADVDSAVNVISGPYTAGVIFGGIITILLWLWMAWKNGQGRRWARIVATVLFALHTVALLTSFVGPPRMTGAAVWVSLLSWLVGLAAIYFLWRRDASDYYDRMSVRT